MRRFEDKLFMAGGHGYDEVYLDPDILEARSNSTLYVINKSESQVNISFGFPFSDAVNPEPDFPFKKYQNPTAVLSSMGTTLEVTLGPNKEAIAYNATAYECRVTNLETLFNYGFGPVKGQIDYVLNQYNLYNLGGYVASIYDVVLYSDYVNDISEPDSNEENVSSLVRRVNAVSKGTIHNYGSYPFFLECAHEIDSPIEYPQSARFIKTRVGRELMQETSVLGPRINDVGDSLCGHYYSVPTIGVGEYTGVDDLVNIGIAFQYENDVLRPNGEPLIYEVMIQVNINDIWSPNVDSYIANDLIGKKLQDEFIRKYGGYWISNVVSFVTVPEKYPNPDDWPTVYEWVPFCIKAAPGANFVGVDGNQNPIPTRSIITRFESRPPIVTKSASSWLLPEPTLEETTPRDIVKGAHLEKLIFLPNHEFQEVDGINNDPSIGFINLARVNIFNHNDIAELDADQTDVEKVEILHDAITIMNTVDALNHKPTLYSYLTEEEKLLSENWDME